MRVLAICVLSLSTLSIRGQSFGPVKSGAGGYDDDALSSVGLTGNRRAIVIRNFGNDWTRVWCTLKGDTTGERQLNKGGYLFFTFQPLVREGIAMLWCTAGNKRSWTRWNAFGPSTYHLNNRLNDKAYEYSILNDGVYYNKKKISSFSSGFYP